MAPQDALVKRDQVDGDNGSVFASFIIFLSIFILFLSYGFVAFTSLRTFFANLHLYSRIGYGDDVDWRKDNTH